MFIQESYTRKACIFIERSIDILAPSLDNETILKLKAEYRSIDNANKFYALEAKLRLLEKEKHVKLPKFTVIR